MGYPRVISIPVTTDGDGDADVLSGDLAFGEIAEIVYVPSGSPIDEGGAVITAENQEITGLIRPIMTLASAEVTGTNVLRWAPRQPVHAVADGSALSYDATEPVTDRIPVLDNDRIRVVVSGGGDTKSGTFYVLII